MSWGEVVKAPDRFPCLSGKPPHPIIYKTVPVIEELSGIVTAGEVTCYLSVEITILKKLQDH